MGGPGDTFPRFRAAAVQAAPVFLDRQATVDRIESYAAEAARNGADLVVFSESYLPAFPLWNLVVPPVDQHELFRVLYEQAVPVPGPTTERLAGIARHHGVHLSVGVTERSAVSMGGLYNTNLLFDRAGRLVNRHRKLVPTWAEKLTWANGDASDLRPVDTDLGRLGVLICGENTNTLARYALLAQGEQIHIATYPPAWPFQRPDVAHRYDLARAVEIRSAAHAFEGKVFNIVASGRLDQDAVDHVARLAPDAKDILESAPPPASMILHPTGEVCAGPLVGEEGIVYADIDVAESIVPKQAHDIVGYYQRPDIFRFEVDQRPQRLVDLHRDEPAGPPPDDGAQTIGGFADDPMTEG